jgi:hypothetical protein
MNEHPLAFEFSKTRTICNAFDQAWAFLQDLGATSRNHPSHSGSAARLISGEKVYWSFWESGRTFV